MGLSSLWIMGQSRSGKTTRLVREFRQWVLKASHRDRTAQITPALLVFAANDDNRRDLRDRLAIASDGSYPAISKTPLGFISDEVMLFWPLLFEQLKVKAQFPLRLRPETEQELAVQLWQPILEREKLSLFGQNESRFVRQTLDLLQLAGAACIPAEDIPQMLEWGLMAEQWEASLTANPSAVEGEGAVGKLRGQLLLEWRQWCLERGFLTYGTIYELYWRYLLPNSTYQHHLSRRYRGIFADDVDDYPAIAKDLIDVLLNCGAIGTFTFNPDGKIRLGLSADPNYLEGLASRCQIVEMGGRFQSTVNSQQLSVREQRSRGAMLAPGAGEHGKSLNIPPSSSPIALGEMVVEMVKDPGSFNNLPPSIQSMQTTSRAGMLRQTADLIAQAVKQGEVQPEEIAIIAPGLDAIARYTLIEILSHQNVPIEPLNEQRPLISSPLVRALLTLLAFIYSGLGRLIERDTVAEMLVVLSGQLAPERKEEERLSAAIDPVRAGLLADHCYYFDLEHPHLLPIESFPRWDRLGHRAAIAYQTICTWIDETKILQQQHSPSVPILLDRAIKSFLGNDAQLPFERLAALRELMETAQHFWQVDGRLRQNQPLDRSQTDTVAQFIQLLRRGTITANAYPVRPLGLRDRNPVTLATIFQYRSSRRAHRWHFWLDAASPLWAKGGAATLFAAPLFLRDWSGFPWTPEDQIQADSDRTDRILRDLLARAQERVYLCHSDLATNGNEQTGPLLPLVYASQPLERSGEEPEF